jgi:hypothetical protein
MVFLTRKRTRKTRIKEDRKITDFTDIADPGGPEEGSAAARRPP